MSARVPEPCDGIRGDHDGPVRFFRTGWKCRAHSPEAEARWADTASEQAERATETTS